jgi:Cu(I)/Ag(I) efflux system membrane protein CusA/SilA
VLWSGQYEAMARVHARLTYIIPFTVFLVFVLLYLNTRPLAKTAIVLLAVPFSAVAAVPARLQHEHRRMGRAQRAARH